MQWSPAAMINHAEEQSPEVAAASQSPSGPPPPPAPPAAALLRLPASTLLASGVVFNLAFLFKPWQATTSKLTTATN